MKRPVVAKMAARRPKMAPVAGAKSKLYGYTKLATAILYLVGNTSSRKNTEVQQLGSRLVTVDG